jgi:hypothetical protein
MFALVKKGFHKATPNVLSALNKPMITYFGTQSSPMKFTINANLSNLSQTSTNQRWLAIAQLQIKYR